MTQAGAVFKPHVDALLHQLDDGIAAISQLTEPGTGTITLAFQISLGTWLIPDLVRSFRATYPDVNFQLRQVRGDLNATPLDGGRADLEIGMRYPPDPAAHSQLLALEPLRLALPRDHPLAARAQIRLAEMADEPFVSLRRPSPLRRQADELCARAGFRPEVVFEGDDQSTVRGFVAAGLGVAILPAPRVGSPESAAGPVTYAEILDTGAVREICVTWPSGRRLLPSAELFRQHVIARAAAGRIPALADRELFAG
jgi:LysR family transcriptional regulator, transcription activator of glutamate synthase operon